MSLTCRTRVMSLTSRLHRRFLHSTTKQSHLVHHLTGKPHRHGVQDSKRSRVSASTQTEVLLVFNSDTDSSDLQAISGKLNRLKRLLVKRFDAVRGSPSAVQALAASPADLLLLRILVNQVRPPDLKSVESVEHLKSVCYLKAPSIHLKAYIPVV